MNPGSSPDPKRDSSDEVRPAPPQFEDITEAAPPAPSGGVIRTPVRSFLKNRALWVFLQPLALLAAVSCLLLYLTWRLDAQAQPKNKSIGLIDLLAHFDPERAVDVLGNVSQVVAQILGVAISVVAIIVELASNRYTHRITELFFRTRVNFVVMGLFVIATLDGLWVSLMFRHDFVPMRSALVAMMLMTVSVLLLLPYFAYVFHFVNPMNFVSRIRSETLSAVTSAPRRIALATDNAEDVQHVSSDGAEQLSDVALNAMANHDGAIAMASVNALGDLGRDYLDVKGALPLDWFRVTDVVTQNPDFVSMSRDMLDELFTERMWFEFKLLRQFQTIYLAALNANRELCYVVAIRTRELAERAMDHADPLVAGLCIKFFNTYLRSTVNARDVRTAYNVLNQYRLLAEGALVRGVGHFAVEIARYFKYYGLLAFHADLGFILETAAYDLCALNELAFDMKTAERAELLKIFLQVDKEGEGAAREASLRGVRKAQVKLATYYLVHGDEAAAREVFHDMREEKPGRLASIRDEMLSINSPHFWEITDRGSNFDYIPPERKRRLVEFFEWFGGTLAPPRSSIMPPTAAAVPAPVDPQKPSAESAAAATVTSPGDGSSTR